MMHGLAVYVTNAQIALEERGHRLEGNGGRHADLQHKSELDLGYRLLIANVS